MLTKERFWLEEPISLFYSANLIPQCTMTVAERLNALTRLILVITLILYLFCLGQWWLFLILGILLVIVLYYLSKGDSTGTTIEHYICSSKRTQPSMVSSGAISPKGFEPYL